jgi:regulator of protease activity HflC (stomatin/prohibitin superfamily)
VRPLAEKGAKAARVARAEAEAVKEGREERVVEVAVKEKARAAKAAVVRVRAEREEGATDRRRQSLSPRSFCTHSTFQA